MKKCPYCAEEIQDEAVVCKHCHRDIASQGPKQKKKWTWWKLLIAVLAVLWLIGYLANLVEDSGSSSAKGGVTAEEQARIDEMANKLGKLNEAIREGRTMRNNRVEAAIEGCRRYGKPGSVWYHEVANTGVFYTYVLVTGSRSFDIDMCLGLAGESYVLEELGSAGKKPAGMKVCQSVKSGRGKTDGVVYCFSDDNRLRVEDRDGILWEINLSASN